MTNILNNMLIELKNNYIFFLLKNYQMILKDIYIMNFLIQYII